MTTHSMAAPNDERLGMVSAYAPIPKLRQTIDLDDVGSAPLVRKLTFSPNGRYLAIVVNPAWMQTDIVVWDLPEDEQQAHIHTPSNYGDKSDHDLLWSRDGKVISFGAKRQWDPMTGAELPDNPAIGRGARLNKDGSKMLTIVGALGEPTTIHIYDTHTWALQKLYADGFAVESASWTGDDKIVMAVGITQETFGKTIDGYTTIHSHDAALRLMDPAGKEATKAVWFPAKPSGDPKYPFIHSFPTGSRAVSNFPRNEIFLGAGKIIDGATLNIRSYHAADTSDLAPGAFGMGFSQDGRLLYLKGASFKRGGHAPIMNSVVDVASGKLLSEFDGAGDNQGNLAVSPDGKLLALGDGPAVLIFNLQ